MSGDTRIADEVYFLPLVFVDFLVSEVSINGYLHLCETSSAVCGGRRIVFVAPQTEFVGENSLHTYVGTVTSCCTEVTQKLRNVDVKWVKL